MLQPISKGPDMELAPVENLGTVTWNDRDLNREVLSFQRFLLECLVSGAGWIDPGERPHVALQLDGKSMLARVGCIEIDHDAIVMIVSAPVESATPSFSTVFFCLVKGRTFEWELVEQCVVRPTQDDGTIQQQANRALAMLLVYMQD